MENSIQTFYNLYVTGHVVVILVGLGINLAIFIKQKQLKKKNPSDYKLWKFKRNVISPLGGVLSFLASLIYNLVGSHLYFYEASGESQISGELLLFSVHCVYFFGLNFIEFICSPTLRNVFPWTNYAVKFKIHSVMV